MEFHKKEKQARPDHTECAAGRGPEWRYKDMARMKKLFRTADRYLEHSNWKQFSVIKLCILSAGAMCGMLVKNEHRKRFFPFVAAVFTAAYIPLMARFLRIYRETGEEGFYDS